MNVNDKTPATRGRTREQIAAALDCTPEAASMLLFELERDGIAERDGEFWRLTEEAEREFGEAFRLLPVP